ncbi:MAG TPA: hypothetical protein VHE33_19570 [Acidobacteriaceae bacterium]|nr:hypothetical protein [Acidobacteriaceae bacterium]
MEIWAFANETEIGRAARAKRTDSFLMREVSTFWTFVEKRDLNVRHQRSKVNGIFGNLAARDGKIHAGMTTDAVGALGMAQQGYDRLSERIESWRRKQIAATECYLPNKRPISPGRFTSSS